MKLKGKLVSKKRTREVEDIGTKTADQSDDEEESRAGAIKKKARVDPFAAKGKKKQTGNNFVQNALPTKSKPSPPHTPPRATSPSAEAQGDATVVEPPNNPADEVSTGSPSKKTKKKKKHKDGNKEDKEAEDTVIGQERGATTSPTKVVTKPLSTADQHRDSTPPRGGFHKTEDPGEKILADSLQSIVRATLPCAPPVFAPYLCPSVSLISVPETPRVSTSTPQTTQAKETATPKPTGEASGLPLLNLEGPPPTLSLEASPAKKKRKRNRKKKKKQSEGGGQAQQSADHDAEPQDEEEEDE